MTREFKDRVQDTTQTTGTGPFTLDAATIAGFRTFGSAHTVGATFEYFVGSGSDWEVGYATLSDATHISRTPLASSNGNALVNFGAGSKTIFETVSAYHIAKALTAQDVAFSTSIPLTTPGNSYMASQTVSGALTFTPAASAVRGALTYLRLIADGANVPNYSAFKEWGGSMGYLNTAGIENQMQFFFDGFNYFVSISQAVNAVAVPLPASGVTLTGPTGGIVNQASTAYTVGVTPVGGLITGSVVVTPTAVTGVTFSPTSLTLSSGTPTGTFTATSTTTGAKTIAVTNNASLTNPSAITLTVAAAATVPSAPAAPTATGGTASASIAFVAPSAGTGTISSYAFTPYLAGVAQTVQNTTTLTSPFVATGLAAGSYTFTFHAVSNVGAGAESPASTATTVAAAASYPRLAQFASGDMVESGTGPYSYAVLGMGFSGTPIGGVATKKLPAGTDGSFDLAWTSSNSGEVFLVFTASATPVAYNNGFLTGVWGQQGAGNYNNFGSITGSKNAIVIASGDRIRIARTNSTAAANSATATLSVSKDSGSTWNVLATWTSCPTTDLYIQAGMGTHAGNISSLASSGLA